jgi:hypothetical protein
MTNKEAMMSCSSPPSRQDGEGSFDFKFGPGTSSRSLHFAIPTAFTGKSVRLPTHPVSVQQVGARPLQVLLLNSGYNAFNGTAGRGVDT